MNYGKMFKCLLGFFDDDTAIIKFDEHKRLFLLLLQCKSRSSHFVLIKLISDEPCDLYGFNPDVEYYPVQIAECSRTDLSDILSAFNSLVSLDYVPF